MQAAAFGVDLHCGLGCSLHCGLRLGCFFFLILRGGLSSTEPTLRFISYWCRGSSLRLLCYEVGLWRWCYLRNRLRLTLTGDVQYVSGIKQLLHCSVLILVKEAAVLKRQLGEAGIGVERDDCLDCFDGDTPHRQFLLVGRQALQCSGCDLQQVGRPTGIIGCHDRETLLVSTGFDLRAHRGDLGTPSIHRAASASAVLRVSAVGVRTQPVQREAVRRRRLCIRCPLLCVVRL